MILCCFDKLSKSSISGIKPYSVKEPYPNHILDSVLKLIPRKKRNRRQNKNFSKNSSVFSEKAFEKDAQNSVSKETKEKSFESLVLKESIAVTQLLDMVKGLTQALSSRPTSSVSPSQENYNKISGRSLQLIQSFLIQKIKSLQVDNDLLNLFVEIACEN